MGAWKDKSISDHLKPHQSGPAAAAGAWGRIRGDRLGQHHTSLQRQQAPLAVVEQLQPADVRAEFHRHLPLPTPERRAAPAAHPRQRRIP